MKRPLRWLVAFACLFALLPSRLRAAEFTLNRQGPDVGDQYRSAIFYFDKEQQAIAEEVKTVTQKTFKAPIVTEISNAGEFYDAEPYHQKYSERTGIGMCHVAYEPIPQA